MIDKLPYELVNSIIQLSLPPLKLTTYSERYFILRSCSLVCRSWNVVAQQKLIKHVAIKTPTKLNLFLNDTIAKDYEAVQSIFVDAEDFVEYVPHVSDLRLSFGNLCKLFNTCLNVKEIWFISLDFEDLSSDEEGLRIRWSNLEKLTSIHLIGCDITDISSPLSENPEVSPFPHLYHLTLQDVYFYDQLITRPLLQSFNFPVLTSLALVNRSDDSYTVAAPLEVSSSLAEQIRFLIYYDVHDDSETLFVEKQLGKFRILESLILRDTYSIENFFIPPTLASLAMLLEAHGAPELSVIKEWIRSTSSPLLKYVQLPAVGHLDVLEVEKLSASRQIEWNYVTYDEDQFDNQWKLSDFLSDLRTSKNWSQ